MQENETTGSGTWNDPDDAPPLTREMRDQAEEFQGDTFVRRGRGRPPTGAAKEQISVRIDRDILAKLREAGPGWQSQINRLLREAVFPKVSPATELALPGGPGVTFGGFSVIEDVYIGHASSDRDPLRHED